MSIFISYSRHDAEFVRRLHDAIASRGRATWVDWEGIPPTADWMREIHAAIDAAEAVVFVLSPDSIGSNVCTQELEHAASQNKRLIPVVCREVTPDETPLAVAKLNWIFFTNDNFAAAFDTLLRAIDTDLDWVNAHTRLIVRAAEWDRKNREASLALRGADLTAAERWLTQGPKKTPQPTELQTRYILESRRQATQRRYLLLGGVAVALIVTAALGTLFLLQRTETAKQQAAIAARRLAATAQRVREAPLEHSTDTNRVELSAQLAAEALRRVDAFGLTSAEADGALRLAVSLLPERIARLESEGAPAFQALAFNRGGEIAAASRELSSTAVWDVDLRLQGGKRGDTGANEVILSPDGKTLAAIQPGDRQGIVEVRDTKTHQLLASLSDVGQIAFVALAPKGTHLVISTDESSDRSKVSFTRVWSLPEPKEVVRLPRIAFPSFSPDGAYLAGLVNDKPLIWSMERLARGAREPLRSLAPEVPGARAPLFSPDGTRFVMAYADDPIRVGIWSVGDWMKVRDFETPVGEGVVAVSPGARHLAFAESYGAGFRIHVVDDADAHCVLAQLTVQARDPAIAFDIDRLRVAALSAKGIEVFRLPPRCGFATHVADITGGVALAFAPDGEQLTVLATSGEAPSAPLLMQTVSAVSGRRMEAKTLPGATRAELSPDGRWLALGSGTRVSVVEVATGVQRGSATTSTEVRALAIAAGATHVVATTQQNGLHVWQGASMQQPASTVAPDALLPGFLAVGPRRLVAISRGASTRIGKRETLRSWVFPSMTMAEQPVGQDRGGFAASACALAQNGSRIAVQAKGIGIVIRDTESRATLGVVDADDAIGSCTFSVDGRYLAIWGAGVVVWDIAAQSAVARIGTATPIEKVAFSPDNRYLAVLAKHGTVSISSLRPRDLIAQACSRLGANISVEDWERFVGQEPRTVACPRLEEIAH
jgi:WD40 repeat protein